MLRLTALATMLVALVAAMMTSSASEPSAEGDRRASDISHSENFDEVANVPKRPPLDETASDLAFHGDYAYQGNYNGFTIYDISRPKRPQIVSQVLCPGGQGDVTVSPDGDLLFVSVDYERTNNTCGSQPTNSTDKPVWEGVRVFDVSDPRKPEYVRAVKTSCGSHTHTLVPDQAGESVFLYVSSYGPSETFPNCKPPHDSISIIEVPLDDPETASVVATPSLFPKGGAPGTSGCHDITVYPDRDLAAGACMGDGLLMDISKRTKPKVLDRVQDDNFAFWHSATFNNHATKVIFTDELGGGGAPTCNKKVGPKRGADAIFDIVGAGRSRELAFRSYYKIPRHQTDTENCVAHNGALIPVQGRDVMVQAWYQGGVSVLDFTDSEKPREVGYWDRGPLSEENLVLGGSWSAYYYNGFIYSSDIAKGLDVLEIRGMKGAKRVEWDVFNAQTQYQYPESASGAVAAGDDGNGRSAGTRVIVPRGPGEPADVGSGRSDRALEVDRRSARSERANAADREFVRHMIPHHYQAILMSRLAPQRAGDRRVRSIAGRIRTEQGVEIDGMQGWQGREGLPVTDEVESYHHMLHDPEMLEHMGMATPREMRQLRAADGRAFDRMYIKLMIPHHEAAIRMAEEVAGTGTDMYIRQVAIDLISTQSRQVHDMREIRRSW